MLREGDALGDGHGCEHQPVRAVSDGVDVGNAGARVAVHDDLTIPPQLDTRLLEAEVGGLRHPPGGVEDLVGLERAAVVHAQAEPAAAALDGGEILLEAQVDSLLAHLVGQYHSDVVVEAAHEERTAV